MISGGKDQNKFTFLQNTLRDIALFTNRFTYLQKECENVQKDILSVSETVKIFDSRIGTKERSALERRFIDAFNKPPEGSKPIVPDVLVMNSEVRILEQQKKSRNNNSLKQQPKSIDEQQELRTYFSSDKSKLEVINRLFAVVQQNQAALITIEKLYKDYKKTQTALQKEVKSYTSPSEAEDRIFSVTSAKIQIKEDSPPEMSPVPGKLKRNVYVTTTTSLQNKKQKTE